VLVQRERIRVDVSDADGGKTKKKAKAKKSDDQSTRAVQSVRRNYDDFGAEVWWCSLSTSVLKVSVSDAIEPSPWD